MSTPIIVGGVIVGIAALAASATAAYQYSNKSEDADVASVTTSESREECRDEVVTFTRDPKDPDRIVGTVAGAVLGGVAGSQIGGGSGKTVATIGGTMAGGYAGNKIQEAMQGRDVYETTQPVCTTVQDTGT